MIGRAAMDGAQAGDSLARRRRQIRRRRRPLVRWLASGATWGTVLLLCAWLLFSGIFGFPNA